MLALKKAFPKFLFIGAYDKMVMKNGELFDADTLNQTWPNQKPLAPQYWWNLDPK